MKNKMMKTQAIALALTGVLMFATGCGSKQETAEAVSEDAVTFTDMFDREVVIEGPVEEIVALTAGDCEILYEIGAGDMLIGRGEYCNYPEEIMEVEALSSGTETNIEQIIALQPDLVIMAKMNQDPEQMDAIENAGIPVLVTDADSIEDTYTAIEMIGKAVGKEENAAAVIEEMKANFEEMKSKITDKEAKKVYFEVSPLEYGLWSCGSNTFMSEMANMLGLENIFGELDIWAEVSEEQVLSRNPDYIFTVTMFFGEGPTPEEEIMGRDGWGNISAVQNGDVYRVDNDMFTRPGPRLDEACQELFNIIYGE